MERPIKDQIKEDKVLISLTISCDLQIIEKKEYH